MKQYKDMDVSFTGEEIRTIVVPILCAMIPNFKDSDKSPVPYAFQLAENVMMDAERRGLEMEKRIADDQAEAHKLALKKFDEMRRGFAI